MNGRQRFSPPAVGGSSLLVVFGVLALSVFGLLSLASALSYQRLADSSLKATTAYYQADNRAGEIFAALRAGEISPEVERQGEIYMFRCEISESQQLMVELVQEGDSWRVLRWQAVPCGKEAEEQTIPVWDGEFP